jgi:hypothetical protein
MFPGMRGRFVTLTRFMADKIFKAACDAKGAAKGRSRRYDLTGVSTHSFRQTALTQMKERWHSSTLYSGNIGTQRFRDFAALSGSDSRAETLWGCCDWILMRIALTQATQTPLSNWVETSPN